MDDVEIVSHYVEASQRARASGDPADFEALRDYLHDEVTITLANSWGEEPWRSVWHGADAVVARLREAVNAAPSLVTETTNVVQAGSDVLVEQVSTMDGRARSAVCFLFTVDGGRITAIRTYRNDANLPT